MTYMYSKSKNGFYLSGIHGNKIPSDAVEITDQQYDETCANPSDGTILSSDANGYPIRIVPAAKTNAQLMSEELTALSVSFKASIMQINQDWLSASVNDGATEVSKKAAITQRRIDITTKYNQDIVAIKLKYA